MRSPVLQRCNTSAGRNLNCPTETKALSLLPPSSFRPSSAALLPGVTGVSGKQLEWLFMFPPLYLNKYLSAGRRGSCFPTVVYGTSRIRERMGSDRE